MPLPERHRDHAGTHRALDQDRRLDRAVLGFDLDDVVLGDAELARRLGMHLGPAVPHDLRDRLRQLLQPRLVRAAPVVKKNVWIGVNREFHLSRGRHRRFERRGVEFERRQMLFLEQSAFAPDVYPEIIRNRAVRFGSQRQPLGFDRLRGSRPRKLRARGSAGGREQDIARRLAVEHRLHHRLSQSADSRARRRVAPRFERMMRRQDETRHRRGLVRHAARPHHERNLLQRLGHSRRRRHREDRIRARDEHRVDLAAAHRVNRRINFVRRAGLFGRRAFQEHYGPAEIAGDRIEDHHRKMS